mgnify:CR=1 FL=1
MKRILAIAVAALMLVAALTVNVFALKDTASITVQIFAQPNSDWSWHSAAFTTAIPLGGTATIMTDDPFVFDGLSSSAPITFGTQIGDDTIENAGESTTITFSYTDIVITADGYDDFVIPGGTVTASLSATQESWGIAGNSTTIIFDLSAATGSSDPVEHAKYLDAFTSATYDITYLAYNGVMADGTPYTEGASADAPAEDTADDTADDTAPAEDITPVEDTTTAEDTTTSAPADTGIALALVPMAIAAAAVVVSKRR